MERHESFMAQETTEVTHFIIKTSDHPKILTEMLDAFIKHVKEAYQNPDSMRVLKTIRIILCSFYQEKLDPGLDEISSSKFDKQLRVCKSKQINVDEIQTILYDQISGKVCPYWVGISLVLEILVLYMSLCCDELAIWTYLEKLQDLIHSHLDEDNEIHLLDSKFMDCYLDSLMSHHGSSYSTKSQGGETATKSPLEYAKRLLKYGGILKNYQESNVASICDKISDKGVLNVPKSLGSETVAESLLDNVERWLEHGEILKNCQKCEFLTLSLPKVISLFDHTTILTKVWRMIFRLKIDSGETLSILILTADVWFPIESNYDKALIDQAMEEPLWLLLLKGLSSQIPEQQKQALDLIKRVVDFVEKHKTRDFEMGNYQEIRPLICTGNDSRHNSFKKNRDNFYLILEALEKSETHLVQPVFPLLNDLLNEIFKQGNRETGFHIAWIRCAFIRILQHDNKDIVKWGLLNTPTVDLEIYNDEFLSTFLDLLNNTYLYENDSNEEKPIVVKQLGIFLNHTESKSSNLITRFLVKASKMKWSHVALYYVIHALSMVRRVTRVWEEAELEAVKSLAEIISTMDCQILRIGSQIELLEVMTHFATESLDLVIIANTLSAFSASEALIRGQLSWKRVSAWLSEIVKKEEALSFLEKICRQSVNEQLQKGLSMELFSLIIMLFHDENLILDSKSCPGVEALRNLLDCLIGTDSRPYADAELRKKSIELIAHLLGFMTSEDFILCELVSNYTDVILKLTFKNLRKTHDKAFVDNIDTHVSITQRILTAENSIMPKREILNHIERFEVESWNIIEDGELSSNVQRLFGIRILYLCLKVSSAKHRNYRFIGPLYKTYKTITTQSPQNVNATRNETTSSSREIATEYYKFVAELFYEYVKDEVSDEQMKDINWIDLVLYLIQVGDADIFVSLVGILSQLFYKGVVPETDMDNFKSAMRLCLKSMLKSNKYQLALEEMMSFIFSSPFLESEETRKLTIEFTHEMLEKADKVSGLSIILVRGLKQAKGEYLNHFYDAVLVFLLYGADPNQDQKIELQARSYILDCYQEVYPNYLCDINVNDNAATRAHAVTRLHKMITDDPTHAAKLLPLIVAKLEESNDEQNFTEPQMSHLKIRIMQVLLILQPILEKDDIESLHLLMCGNILGKSDEPSVRIMQEWLLIRIYLDNETLRAKIWDLFDQVQEKQTASLRSIVIIVYQVARSLSSESQLEFINLAYQYIIPCCMAQQFDVRLSAQVIALKLYNLATEQCHSTITERYKDFYMAVTRNLKYENLEEKSTKLLNDFYFTAFNPIDYYSLQTVFYELPRLSNISMSEYIPSQMFEKFGFKESNSHPLKLLNPNSDMSEAEVSAYCETMKGLGFQSI